MKIPKDKLPIKVVRKSMYGQYLITCLHPKPEILNQRKYAGQIMYKDLSQYVVKASNNFPEALRLLRLSIERLEINNIEKSEEKFINEIMNFINQFE